MFGTGLPEVCLVVLAFILYRQLQARPVRDNMRLPLIIAIIGVVQLVQYLRLILQARARRIADTSPQHTGAPTAIR